MSAAVLGSRTDKASAAKVWRISYRPAGPVVQAFHQSKAFVKGIRGPVGSAKSSACVVEMLRLAASQPPDVFCNRKTRWAAIRNTYPELKSTTLKTFHDWVPIEMCRTWDDAPITRLFQCTLPDGTKIHMEVLFISCDRPADIAKLKSLELSGLWLNESSELFKEVLDMGTTRITRFPRHADGGPAHPVVIMDTNSMDDDHWWYKMDVERDAKAIEAISEVLRSIGIDRPLIEFFTQPPGLIEANGTYVPNPEAENIQNLSLGAGYYLMMTAGKTQAWIDMYVLNKYGRVVDGKAVYDGEWNEHFHGKARDLRPFEGLDIGIGMDFGLSPAAVPAQLTPDGQLLVLSELCAVERSMGLEQFVESAMKPWLVNRFGRRWRFYVVGDPSGERRSETDESYCFQVLDKHGFDARGALTNVWYPRREAIGFFLRRQVRGEPAILFDNSCKLVKAGIAGRYHYRRIQVAGSESRLQDTPYKNKWSHPTEALQYIALEFTGIAEEDDKPMGSEPTMPDWMRKHLSGDLPPWRTSGRIH